MARPETLRNALPGLRDTVRYFARYLQKERPLVIGSSAALFAEVALRVLEPWPLKFVFDYVLGSLPIPEQLAWIGEPFTFLTLSAVALVLLTGFRAYAAYLSTVGFALVGNRVLNEVRSDLYRHIQSLSLSFHNKSRSGDLVVRVVSDVGMLKDVVVTALLPLLSNTLILVVMLGLMFWLNPQLAAIALLALPLFFIPTLRLSKRIRKVSHDQRRREGAMASTAAESFGAVKVVQALSLQETFAESFAGQNRRELKDGVKGKRLAASLERTVDLVIAVATALVLWYGARLVLRSQLTPGDLLVFLAYLKNAFKPLQSFAKYTGRLAKASAAGERIIDVLKRKPEVSDMPGAIEVSHVCGEVSFDSVTFGYDEGGSILKNVSFEVAAGRHVAIVGPSGSGKSTLTSLLLRLYDPSKGNIRVDQRDLRSYTVASLRAQMSVVMQDSILFAGSIRDNIAVAKPGAAFEAIVEAAVLADAHNFIQELPQGYDTIVSERGTTLSGGQRQRIAIARAAVRNTPILILDEPTTGLDEESEQIVEEALVRLARGRTTLVVTHDLHFASQADEILYLDEGMILERGTHAELVRAGGKYAGLWAMFEEQRATLNENSRSYAVAS